MQALYLLALEPVAETTADPNSYGFRKNRRTQDAAEQLFINLGKKYSPKWILDADITGCFDNISHEWLMANIPMDKDILRKWLKSVTFWQYGARDFSLKCRHRKIPKLGVRTDLKHGWFFRLWQRAGWPVAAAVWTPVTGAVEDEAIGAMPEPVQGGGTQHFITGERIAPLAEVEVAGEQGRGALVAFGHQVVEGFVLGRAQGFEAEIVDDEERNVGQGLKTALVGPDGLRLAQAVRATGSGSRTTRRGLGGRRDGRWPGRDGFSPNQQTTSNGRRLSPEQTVTITDPRHPLCGRTLPLIGITHKSYLGRCCVVWLRQDIERWVPVSATDLEFDPNTLHPIPLSVAAVAQLRRVFASIHHARGVNSNGVPADPTDAARHEQLLDRAPGTWVKLTPSQQHHVQHTLITVCQRWLSAQRPAQEGCPHER